MVQDFQTFRWMVKMSPEQVAKVLVAGLRKDSPEIAVGWLSHLALIANRIAPQLVERIVQMGMVQDTRLERNTFAPGAKLFLP